MKRALITGITGQDGSYLAELLLASGYEVHGLVRRVAFEDREHRLSRLLHLLDRLTLHTGSIDSYSSLARVFRDISPDECYHLAAESYAGETFDDDLSTITTNVVGTANVISALGQFSPGCRLYFAGSSEMFGEAEESPQNETTRFQPRSPYGVSKVTGYHLARNYRTKRNMFVACGILFNHESPRRGFQFVTRKISRGVASIKLGLMEKLTLGNLDARRDWGFAGDYVKAMWLMMQTDTPEDYVVATGKLHSVRDLVEAAFACVNLDWKEHVETDQSVYRPAEDVPLCGDASRAKDQIGWEPTMDFASLVQSMVESDLDDLQRRARV